MGMWRFIFVCFCMTITLSKSQFSTYNKSIFLDKFVDTRRILSQHPQHVFRFFHHVSPKKFRLQIFGSLYIIIQNLANFHWKSVVNLFVKVDHFKPRFHNLPIVHCKQQNCYITANRSHLTSLDQFDALLFHSWNLFHKQGMTIPEVRSLDQRYILFSLEPASHCAYLTPWEEQVLSNFFNDTFTFR